MKNFLLHSITIAFGLSVLALQARGETEINFVEEFGDIQSTEEGEGTTLFPQNGLCAKGEEASHEFRLVGCGEYERGDRYKHTDSNKTCQVQTVFQHYTGGCWVHGRCCVGAYASNPQLGLADQTAASAFPFFFGD